MLQGFNGVDIAGAGGTVTNTARIIGTGVDGIILSLGGSVSNSGTGLIQGGGGIEITGGSGTVTNSATIIGTAGLGPVSISPRAAASPTTALA